MYKQKSPALAFEKSYGIVRLRKESDMNAIVKDDVVSRYFLPTFRVITREYPGQVTLEATPWRGKFRHWLRGIARPLDWQNDGPPTWEEFRAMKHFRVSGGVVSASGVLVDLVDRERATPIVAEDELLSLWREQSRSSRRTTVSESARAYEWHLAPDDCASAGVFFSWFWKAESVCENTQSVSITFVPSLLAQLRHWFSLKPYTMTIYAPTAAA